MGKILLDSGDALAAGQSTTVKVPAHLKISSFEIALIGSTGSTALPVDDIVDLKLRRKLKGKGSHTPIQEATGSLVHRIGRYYRNGDVNWTNVGGGDVDIQMLLDQFVPGRQDNILHTFGDEEVKLDLNWGDLSNASSLQYEVHARLNNAGVEQYMRRIGMTDLQMSSGASKDRDTDKNCHRLWLYNPDAVIKDNSVDVSEWVGEDETAHYEDLGYSDIERMNQTDQILDDSGVMEQFTRLRIAEGTQRSEHINDRVSYEMKGSGSGNVYLVHDRVDFKNARNRDSVRSFARRQRGRVARDNRPASATDVERKLLSKR